MSRLVAILKLKSSAGRNGFMLAELIIIIVMISILVLVVVPKYVDMTQGSKEVTFEANHKMLITAVALYETNNKDKPSTMDDVLPFLNGSISDSPPGAIYSVMDGMVTSKYNLHRDLDKRTLVWFGE